jgi:uncharacterized protein YukE
MADLKVDTDALERTAGALRDLASDLRSAEKHRDEMAGRWGGRQVERAMRGFVDDWDRHRRKLIEALENAGVPCDATVKTFCGIENALADVLAGRLVDASVGGPE